MGQAERPTCPGCGTFLILALPPAARDLARSSASIASGQTPSNPTRLSGFRASYSRRSRAASASFNFPRAGLPSLVRLHKKKRPQPWDEGTGAAYAAGGNGDNN